MRQVWVVLVAAMVLCLAGCSKQAGKPTKPEKYDPNKDGPPSYVDYHQDNDIIGNQVELAAKAGVVTAPPKTATQPSTEPATATTLATTTTATAPATTEPAVPTAPIVGPSTAPAAVPAPPAPGAAPPPPIPPPPPTPPPSGGL